MKRWGLIWLCLVGVLPWLCPPVLAITQEEVSGYWNARFQSRIDMLVKLSPRRVIPLHDSESGTAYLSMEPVSMAFQLHADDWKTDEILAGVYGLAKKGKAVLFTPAPGASAGLENALGAWLRELAAARGLVVSDMSFAFDPPNVIKGKVSGKADPSIKLQILLKGVIFANFNGVEGKCTFNFRSKVVCHGQFLPGTRATVALPSGIPPSGVTVQCVGGSYSLNKDGTFTLASLPPGPFLAVALVGEIPVGLSFFDPAKPSNSISCLETAVAVVMYNTLLFAVPSNLFPQALALVRGLPEVQALGVLLCQEISQRTDAMTRPSPQLTEALQTASAAVQAALRALVSP